MDAKNDAAAGKDKSSDIGKRFRIGEGEEREGGRQMRRSGI